MPVPQGECPSGLQGKGPLAPRVPSHDAVAVCAGLPAESFALTYRRITVTSSTVDAAGRPAQTATASWDGTRGARGPFP